MLGNAVLTAIYGSLDDESPRAADIRGASRPNIAEFAAGLNRFLASCKKSVSVSRTVFTVQMNRPHTPCLAPQARLELLNCLLHGQ